MWDTASGAFLGTLSPLYIYRSLDTLSDDGLVSVQATRRILEDNGLVYLFTCIIWSGGKHFENYALGLAPVYNGMMRLVK